MQTDYIEHSPHHLDREMGLEPGPTVSVSHFTHVIQRYRRPIVLAIASIMLGYLILAVAMYLFSPSERLTSQPFRLDFDAGRGEYPNKSKFNIADIINGPVLTRVWQDNHLSEYLPFGEFSRSVFVLESNRDFELLEAEYRSKLADPKLSPIDRDRLQKEFELKTESIAKSEYSVHFNQPHRGRSVPEPIARKVLLDVLNDWADFAVNHQRVIAYQVSVLSPQTLVPSAIEQKDPVAAIEVLRAKTTRVINNIKRIEKLPGATLARTTSDRLSLEEVRFRLDEILRFRLEPLMAVVLRSPGLVADRTATTRFLESQLAYDKRQLDAVQRNADTVRESILLYEQPAAKENATQPSTKSESAKGPGENLMPQLSDSFLDRLVSLTGRSGDAKYRQDLADQYRITLGETVPLQQAVAYDTQVLDQLRQPPAGASSVNAAAIQAQVNDTRTEVGQAIVRMNELFQIISRNMTPSTQLFTLTEPASTRTMHSVSVQRLFLYGVLLFLLAIPGVVVVCLIHNRVREEETADEYLRQERAAIP